MAVPNAIAIVFKALLGALIVSQALGECKDRIVNCASYDKTTCEPELNKNWSFYWCPKTCRFCSWAVTTTATTTITTGECKDRIMNCASYDKTTLCDRELNKYWSFYWCPKTCRFCGGAVTTTTTTTTTTTSHPRPTTTTAYPTPEKPTHNPNVGKTITTILQRKSKCWQNWIGYEKGETWKNGCETRCTCLDPSKNLISCKPLCRDWRKVLRDGCRLENPPEGQCCSRLICQPSIAIFFPNGHKFE